jgi:hypothetical protein
MIIRFINLGLPFSELTWASFHMLFEKITKVRYLSKIQGIGYFRNIPITMSEHNFGFL